jgi:hypothetical protein
MAHPIVRRLAWGRLSKRMARRARWVIGELRIRRVNKEQAREIAMLAAEINVPKERLVMLLRSHFENIKQANRNGKPLEWAQEMHQDLVRIRELIEQTNPDRKALLRNLMSKPLKGLLAEMEEHAQQMEAMGQTQAAA